MVNSFTKSKIEKIIPEYRIIQSEKKKILHFFFNLYLKLYNIIVMHIYV